MDLALKLELLPLVAGSGVGAAHVAHVVLQDLGRVRLLYTVHVISSLLRSSSHVLKTGAQFSVKNRSSTQCYKQELSSALETGAQFSVKDRNSVQR
jgi:hypothetical protein